MTVRFWLCAGMTLLSNCVSAGYSIAGLIREGKHDQFAAYAASRSISLLVLVLACVILRRKQPLLAFAWYMSII